MDLQKAGLAGMEVYPDTCNGKHLFGAHSGFGSIHIQPYRENFDRGFQRDARMGLHFEFAAEPLPERLTWYEPQ